MLWFIDPTSVASGWMNQSIIFVRLFVRLRWLRFSVVNSVLSLTSVTSSPK
jgi:hypothetical protein